MKLELQQIIGQYVPNIYIDRIILRDNRVELKISLKEIFLNSKTLSLSSFNVLKKFIKIKILSCKNAEVSSNILNLTSEELRNISLFSKDVTVYEEGLPLDSKDLEIDELGFNNLILIKDDRLDTTNLQHLAYFAYCELDTNELCKNFNIVDPTTISFPAKRTSEIIIDSGNVIKNSYIYKLADGTPWTGLIKKVSNIFQTEEEIPRILVEQVIVNEKTHDYRTKNIKISKELQKFTSLEIENDLSKMGIVKSNNNKKVLISNLSKNAEISEDVIIRNSDTNMSIFFAINYDKLIKNNTPFANSLNSYSINKLIEYFKIKDFKLFRKYSSNNDLALKNLRLNEAPVLCTNLFEILEKNGNIVTYCTTDPTSSSVFQGTYQYYVEINFENGVNKFLTEKIQRLIDYEKYLIKFYNICKQPENYNYKQNLFKKQIEDFYTDITSNVSMTDVINVFLECYFLFDSEEFSYDAISEMRQKYLRFISPFNGTIEGVEILKKNYSDLIVSLLNLYGDKKNKSNNILQSSITDSKISYFTKSKLIGNPINFKKQNDFEARYLPKINNSKLNLIDFVNRLKDEKSFFNLDDTKKDYIEEYMYSFISPLYIYSDNVLYNLFSEKYSDSLYENLLNNEILSKNNIKIVKPRSNSIEFTPQDNINLLKNTYNTLSSKGINVEIDTLTLKEINNQSKTTHIDDIEKNIKMISDEDNFDPISLNLLLNSKEIPVELESELPYGAPNQIKDLASLKINNNLAKNIIKYRMLCEIYYLENLGTKNKKWRLLTKSALLNKFNKNNYLLCRLNRHKYSYNKSLYYNSEPYINEYFILDMSDKKINIDSVLNLKQNDSMISTQISENYNNISFNNTSTINQFTYVATNNQLNINSRGGNNFLNRRVNNKNIEILEKNIQSIVKKMQILPPRRRLRDKINPENISISPVTVFGNNTEINKNLNFFLPKKD